MIYSFGANNYFSFKDGFQVSLEFNSKVPKSISKSRKVSTILGIKGANASGKTNILKCLQFISNFITNSFQLETNSKIVLSPFFNSAKPCDFYMDFESNGIKYTYELSATKDHVVREAIYKKISRKTLIIERKFDDIKYKTSEFSSLDLITLKKNSSLIDTAMRYKLKDLGEDLSNIYTFFSKFRGNTSSFGLMDDATLYDYNAVSEYYFKTPLALDFAKKIILASDLGIKDIVIHESTKKEDGETRYFPIFHHDHDLISDNANWLTYWEESDGTTALYRRLCQYWAVLNMGGVLLMDEFDTNYHPALLPQILNLFLDEDTNPNGAQLLFTSHNLEIMDHLGKYRTYLVSKENGESFCYRLDEIPGDIIRNDRSISTLYREGKLGGVPKV